VIPLPSKKSRKVEKTLDFLEYPDTEEWLGKELVEEGNRFLNNSPSKENLIIMYLIAKKNWILAMKENNELQVALNISRGGKD